MICAQAGKGFSRDQIASNNNHFQKASDFSSLFFFRLNIGLNKVLEEENILCCINLFHFFQNLTCLSHLTHVNLNQLNLMLRRFLE